MKKLQSMAKIINIALHHTGGKQNEPFWSSAHLTAEDIDIAHKERFGMKSILNRWGGYNLFYEKNGKRTQFRAIGEETMAQRGNNFDTISMCFAGNQIRRSNGTVVDTPHLEQLMKVTNDLEAVQTHEGHGDSFWSIALALYKNQASGFGLLQDIDNLSGLM